MTSHRKQADQIRNLAESLNCRVDASTANTGTIYLTIEHDRLGRSITIRFADHADAYGRSDYTCDDIEGSVAGAKRFLIDALKTSDLAVRRLLRFRRSSRRRQILNRRTKWIRAYAAQENISEAEAAARCPIQ